MSDIEYPCGREVIASVLPHREPFAWLSRVVSCQPGSSAVAELDVDPNLDLFRGHFPQHPVLPGVITMEALAQAASFCLLVGQAEAGSVGYLVGIDQARFRRQVLPGETLRLEATIVKNTTRMCVADVSAYVGDELCASARQRYILDRG